MEPLEQLLIERECERLVTRYCHYVDHGEAEKIADLFTDDGEWIAGPAKLQGKEQLEKGFITRQAMKGRMSRHVCNNLLLNIVDENTVEGVVYLTLFRADGKIGRLVSPIKDQPIMAGEYRDTFVRTPDGWRISRRQGEFNFIETSTARK